MLAGKFNLYSPPLNAPKTGTPSKWTNGAVGVFINSREIEGSMV
jgi:hypothetical protein